MTSHADLSLAQLRYFVAAANVASMTLAAEQLLVSQSAVSTAVSQLERRTGVSLFVRHHARGLSLTPAGRDFLIQARDLLTHAEEVAESARGLGGRLSGSLVLGCFLTLSPIFLPRMITAMEAQHSGVHLDIREGGADTLHDYLVNGTCELALMYEYDQSASGGLRYDRIGAAEPYVVLPVRHPLATRKRVSLRDLVDEPMVLYDLPQSRDYFTRLAAQVAGVRLKVRYRSSNYETVRALVASGHGFSVLNQRPAFDTTYDGGRLATVSLTDRVPALPIVLASAAGVTMTRRARAFSEIARAVVADTHPT